MGVYAAIIILLCAERFAEALVASGAIAGHQRILARSSGSRRSLRRRRSCSWRGSTPGGCNTNAGLGTLVSSKVNQWTLLVGTLPIVFAISSGSLHGLPIDAVQREELFLTAAQSFFAIAVLLNLRMSLREACFLFGLFWGQFLLGGLVPEHLHGIERDRASASST